MSRLTDAFKNGKAFIPFITCGDPDLDTTARIVKEMSANGADIIELGIPFSDPTAEGPVIQAANLRALSGGVTTDKIFDFVRELRKEVDTPMVFMTYANVVFSYGQDKQQDLQQTGRKDGRRGLEGFAAACGEIGIDGLILPDVPYEEKQEFEPVCRKYGVELVSLIAPTSENRISKIAREAAGFVYLVSSLGVTGVRSEITTDIGAIAGLVRENSTVPCAVGFGISTPEQAAKMAAVADGVIVGSAIVKIVAERKTEAPRYVGEYVKSMKSAIEGV